MSAEGKKMNIVGRSRRPDFWVLLVPVALLSVGCADMGEPDPSTYYDEIQPIFNQSCVGCHTKDVDRTTFSLMADDSYAYLVGVASVQVDTLLRVDPGDPDASYLVMKLEQDDPPSGVRMPRNTTPLDPSDIQKIRDWITAGALETDEEEDR